jgi:hypothetical protein
MGRARACALSAGSSLLAVGRRRTEPTGRQQLRAWYYDATRQRGPKRQALRVEPGFAPLRRWVGSDGQGPPRALARDATPGGPRGGIGMKR